MVMPLLLSAFAASGAVRRHAVAFCLGSIGVLIIARLAISLADVPHPFIWALPLRADAFLLGALAAIASKGAKIPSPNLLLAVGVALMASIALMPPIEQSGGTQVLGYTVVAVGCTAIVLASQAPGWLASALACGPARYLGKISYGIYVYHLAALVIAAKLVLRLGVSSPAIEAALALGITIALAATSYRFLERPFLVMKEQFARVSSRPA